MSNTKIELSQFISELNTKIINFDKDVETYQNDIMAIYIYKIAEATAYDTRYTRDLFRGILDQEGYNKLSAKLYIDPYDHWKDLQKRMQKGDTIFFSKSKGKYQLIVDSEAFDMLNTNPSMPSTKHPRGFDPKLQPFIVDCVTDLLESTADNDMEDVISTLVGKIVSFIENNKITRSGVVI